MAGRNVALYIGVSLDGYIATKDDSLEWLLNAHGEGDNGFAAFYDTVDTVIMGRRTYDWILDHDGQPPYSDKECYVYTSKRADQKDNITFTSMDMAALIADLRQTDGKRIWIVGGAEIIDMARKRGLIDEYILCIAPVILGSGIPLFREGEGETLKLIGTRIYGDFAEIHYSKI